LAQLKDVTPLFPVSDIHDAKTFFVDVLKFECRFQQENYAYLKFDDVAIRLIEVGDDVDLEDPRTQQSCYIDVEGLDDLYAMLKPGLELMPEGRVRAPFNQSYGQREFHVIYEALLLFYGESIHQKA